MTREFQFSLRVIFLTVAAVAVLLALMFHVPLKGACLTLAALVVALAALAFTGLTTEQSSFRAFCIGRAADEHLSRLPLRSVPLVHGTTVTRRICHPRAVGRTFPCAARSSD